MAFQGYDNEGCMPGDRERFARMHDRRLENDCKRRIATAKRDLAEKVLAAIDGVRRAAHITGEGLAVELVERNELRAAVERVFVECGVEVEKGGDG